MTAFDRAAAAAHRPIDRLFAERFRLEPRSAEPNKRSGPDAGRAVLDVDGIFVEPAARARSENAAKGYVKPEMPGQALSRPVLDLPANVRLWGPKAGDHAVRLKTGERFELGEQRPAEHDGRVLFDLLVLGRGP
jgi:hypothetical protein